MAVVLPFCEFVETGYAAGVQMHLYAVHRYNRGSCSVGTGQRPPIDPLPMRGARCRDNASFERSLSALVTRVLLPAVRRAAVHGHVLGRVAGPREVRAGARDDAALHAERRRALVRLPGLLL